METQKTPEIGFNRTDPIIHNRLQLDKYKISMGAAIHALHPVVNAESVFINRTNTNLSETIDKTQLREELEAIQSIVVKNRDSSLVSTSSEHSPKEYFHLKGQGIYTDSYIDMLLHSPPIGYNLTWDPEGFKLSFPGKWYLQTYWETCALAVINQLHYEGVMRREGINLVDVENQGMRNLDHKIKVLRRNPDIKIVGFGHRRAFSQVWEEKVTERLIAEIPEQLLGVSNEYLAMKMGVPSIGTIAHEWFMGYSRLFGNSREAIRDSHHIALQDWWMIYGRTLSIALTDTFGSPFFFESFTEEQANLWRGVRHDSGDPFKFGEITLKFYEQFGIDPNTKTIVFSDGLTLQMILALHARFARRINVVFGWGTNLTNDMDELGKKLFKPLSLVVKLATINGLGTVKLSDNAAKAMGSERNVREFRRHFDYTSYFSEECRF